MFLSFVIPTYERVANLRRVLSSLIFQTDRDFEVIVSDDGSTDGTAAMVRQQAERLPIKYFWHKHQGYRLAMVRNRGAALRDKKTTHVWFLDSDVVLPKDAVAQAKNIYAKHPDVVLAGKYDWMHEHPWPVECGPNYWEEFSKLPFRPDHRKQAFDNETIHTFYEGGVIGANILCPVKWLLKRGFDENIIGGGEDGEFSYHLQEQGAPVIFSSATRGLHMWHPRDPAGDNSMALHIIRTRYLGMDE